MKFTKANAEIAALQLLADLGMTFDRQAPSHMKALLKYRKALTGTKTRAVRRHYAIMSPYLPGEPVGCTWGTDVKDAMSNLEDAHNTVKLLAKKDCPVCNEDK